VSGTLFGVPPNDAERPEDRFIAIGEIAAEIAHELRNALQVIASSAYVAKHQPAAVSESLDKIERQARIAQGIVDSLMALARGEPTHAEPVHLGELISIARDQLDASRAEWLDSLSPQLIRVRVQSDLGVRLFAVLYENALAVSAPQKPRIETHAKVTSSGIVIDVVDDGPGVPEEIRATLFAPLVTSRKGGTGLGLALAKRIVAAHGGTIELVESPKGATFRITLPPP